MAAIESAPDGELESVYGFLTSAEVSTLYRFANKPVFVDLRHELECGIAGIESTHDRRVAITVMRKALNDMEAGMNASERRSKGKKTNRITRELLGEVMAAYFDLLANGAAFPKYAIQAVFNDHQSRNTDEYRKCMDASDWSQKIGRVSTLDAKDWTAAIETAKGISKKAAAFFDGWDLSQRIIGYRANDTINQGLIELGERFMKYTEMQALVVEQAAEIERLRADKINGLTPAQRKALELLKQGNTQAYVVEKTGMSKSTVIRLVKKLKAQGLL